MDEELDIPRHKPENHFAYTNLELAERKKALRDMEHDYSTLPYAWLEMIYDWHKHTPEQEVKTIINKGLWEGPGKFSKNYDWHKHMPKPEVKTIINKAPGSEVDIN